MCPLDHIVLSSALVRDWARAGNIKTHSLSFNDYSWIIFRSVLADGVSLLTRDFGFTSFDIGDSSGYVSAKCMT
jgi:hypothetical protein